MSKGGIVLCSIVILAFVVATYRRNDVWRSDVSIWQDAAQKSPLKPRPRVNLAAAYADAGRLDEAIREYENAILLAQSRPEPERRHGIPRAVSSMGSALISQRRTAEAEALLAKAWADFPAHPGIGVNLAAALLGESRKRLQTAIGVTSEAIAAWQNGFRFEAPGHLFWNRGTAYFMLGDCRRAQQDFQSAQRLDADLARLTVPACAQP